jgi:hypothetical protein
MKSCSKAALPCSPMSSLFRRRLRLPLPAPAEQSESTEAALKALRKCRACSPFSCTHPTHPWENRRRTGHWESPVPRHRLLRSNCHHPNRRQLNRRWTPSRSFHCPLACPSTHRCRCNTWSPECRSDLSRFRGLGGYRRSRQQNAIRDMSFMSTSLINRFGGVIAASHPCTSLTTFRHESDSHIAKN